MDASHDDALPLPLVHARVRGPGPARLRAHQPPRHLRPAPGQLVRRVPARRGLRRLPARLGGARRGRRRPRPRALRVRRDPLGAARGAPCLGAGGRDTARMVHRRHLVAAALRARAGHHRAQSRPVSRRRSTRPGRSTATWVARDSFDVDRVADVYGAVAGADGRLGQQADEAGHQLLDDLPPPLAAGARRRGTARRLPGHGQVGGRQPAVPRPCLSRVDHLDVQGEPPRARAHAPARAPRRPVRGRAEPARGHGRRGPHRPASRARCRCSTRLPAPTSRTSTAPAATSA